MAQRSVWVPWDQQPQEYAPVDPDHPLGRALDAAWIGNDLGGVDVLKGHKLALLSGVTIANTTRGKAFAHNGTSGSVIAIPGEASLPYVQVGYGYFNTAGGAWILSSLNTAAGGYTSRLALASSTTVALDIRWNFGTSRTLTITLPTTLNTPICVALVAYSSTDYRFFCNGQQQNGTLSPGTFGSLDRMFGPGDTINGGVWFTGFGSGVAVTDADMLDITANPEARLWGMFQRRIWVPVVAGAGGGVIGTSTGTFALSATSGGLVSVVGASTGSFSLSGTLSAAVAVAGASAGTFELTGSATGVTTGSSTGASSGTFDLAGSSAGSVAIAGASSGQFDLTGTATGEVGSGSVTGTSDQQLTLSGAASGAVAVAGASAGTFDLSGSGAGINGDGLSNGGGYYDSTRKPPPRKREVRVHKDDRDEREREFQELLARVKGQAVEKAAAVAPKAAEPAPAAPVKPPRMPEIKGVESAQLREWMPELLTAYRAEFQRAYEEAAAAVARARVAQFEDEVALLALAL